MIHLALSNLFQSRVRLAISVAGVALALTLVLALDAIVAGVERQLAAYIDRSGADVWVSQGGVRTLHMASSTVPDGVVDSVRALPGVESVTPILYVTAPIAAGGQGDAGQEFLAYVIGLPPDAAAGGPWRIVEGKGLPGPREAVVDRAAAARAGVGMGSEVRILGRTFRVAGLTAGTATITNSVAFIALDDFRALRGGAPGMSYVLVRAAAARVDGIMAAIQAAHPDLTVQTRARFAAEERRIVADMSTDVIAVMNAVGFVTGLAVLALTVYTAVLSRRREYGVLKALGARGTQLYRVVVAQAYASVGLGLAAGVAVTLALSLVVPHVAVGLTLDVRPESLAKVGLVSLGIAALAAALPVRQIAGLDPAAVYRGR